MRKIVFTLLIIVTSVSLFSGCEMKKFEEIFKGDDSEEVSDSNIENDADPDSINDPDTETEDIDSDAVTNDEDQVQSPENCGSIYFNGVDSYVSVDHDQSLHLGRTWTIEAWVMQDDLPNQSPIIRKGDMTTTPSYWLYGKNTDNTGSYTPRPNGGFQHGINSEDYLWLHSENEIPSMKWFHIALSKSEEKLRLYINGIQRDVVDSGSASLINNQPLYFGVRLNKTPIFLSGLIDEVKLSWIARYDGPFVPERRFESDNETIAIWHFEEKTGTETISEGNRILKGILHGSAHFVNECAEKNSTCENECFFEGQERCYEGVLKTCKKTNDGCYKYESENCPSNRCADNFSCYEEHIDDEDSVPDEDTNDDFVQDDFVQDDFVQDDIVQDDIVQDDIVQDDIVQDDVVQDEDNEIPDEDTSPVCGNSILEEGEICDGGSTSCSDLGIGTFGLATCNYTCNGWNIIDHCKRRVPCSGKPENSHWNIYDSYTQTWKGSSWEPWKLEAYYNPNTGDNDCRFDCDENYIWNSATEECVFGSADNCLAPGLSECSSGQIKVCMKQSDGSLDWSDTENCFTRNCDDETSCLSCSNECDYPGQSMCSQGVISKCVKGGNCLSWDAGEDCYLNECENSEFCKSTGWIDVTAGSLKCAINSSGELFCWEDGLYAQKMSINNDWELINGYEDHFCAIAGGELHCYGDNSSGQLGNGSTVSSDTLIRIGERSDWTSISTKSETTCGIAGGNLFCWGDSTVLSPQKVGTETDWQKVSGNCATASGRIYCWNSFPPAPQQVGTADTWEQVTSGSSTSCAISLGQLYCWTSTNTPSRRGTKSNWTSVECGYEYCCGIESGELFCWGSNVYGKRGESSYMPSAENKVGTRNDWTDISTEDYTTCGTAGNEVYCWGVISDLPAEDQISKPFYIKDDTVWEKVSVGRDHIVGLSEGNIYGNNYFDEIGYNDFVQLPGSSDWTVFSSGYNHGCSIRYGELYCMGYNYHGQIGTGESVSYYYLPERIGTETTWEKVSSGKFYTCGIDNSELFCWGNNSYGQLGDETTDSKNTPQRIGTMETWMEISTGTSHTCGIDANQLYCWGENYYGQLGNGTTVSSLEPVFVDHPTAGWEDVAVGLISTCGIENGKLYCWGVIANKITGLSEQVSKPALISVSSDFKKVVMTNYSVCALKNDNSLYCWNENNYVTGENTAIYPERIAGAVWKDISASNSVMCGISMDNELFCSNMEMTAHSIPVLMQNP